MKTFEDQLRGLPLHPPSPGFLKHGLSLLRPRSGWTRWAMAAALILSLLTNVFLLQQPDRASPPDPVVPSATATTYRISLESSVPGVRNQGVALQEITTP